MKVHLGNGLTAEIETDQDLVLLRKLIAAPLIKGSAPHAPSTTVHLPVNEPKIVSWYRRLGSPAQHRLVEVLVRQPDGVTDSEIREHLKFEKNAQVAGVFCALIRHAKSVGLNMDTVLEKKAVRNGNGSRQYRYVVRAPYREELTRLLNH